MSNVSENELSDIELCYKAMGLSFSDNPEQVEKTYRKLKDEYTKAMRSTEITERVTATENMKQLEELFATITESLIYKDYAREYEKYKASKAEQLVERKQKQQKNREVKEKQFNCPYCYKPIAEKIKVCNYCHGKILSPMEKLLANVFSMRNLMNVFSTRNLIILIILVVLAMAGVVLTSNPHLLKR